MQKCVDLANVNAWEKVEQYEVNVVSIPQKMQMTKECMEAKQAELEKLKMFDTYEEVEFTDQNYISTRWVFFCRKGENIRARLVVRGFEDTSEVEKDSPTVIKSSMRIILTIAAQKKWIIKTTDIKSAFLQGKDIERDVYILPPIEANVGEDKIWKLKKCLYGLNDAARQFYKSVEEELKAIGFVQCSVDPALFFLNKDGQLIGIIGTHIDDFIHCGKEGFDEEVMNRLRKRFTPGKLEEGSFTYVGFEIEQHPEGILMSQDNYIEELRAFHIKPEREKGQTRIIR